MWDKSIKSFAVLVLASAIGYFGIIAILDWPNISARTMSKQAKPKIMLAVYR